MSKATKKPAAKKLKKKPAAKKRKVRRDSRTGEFTTKKFAEEHPDITETETFEEE